jgi:hypothetical protein
MSIVVRNEINITAATEKIKAGNIQAVRKGAEFLLQKSKDHVPHDKGMLENSGSTDYETEGPSATTFYDTPYAVRLHEHPEFRFKGKGRGKWLQTAANENSAAILKVMARCIKEALK